MRVAAARRLLPCGLGAVCGRRRAIGGGPGGVRVRLQRKKMLGWPKICKLARAFLWENSNKRLELAQLLG
jgi:hypothetical protein